MIKLENTVTPSPEQWVAIIMGARNPMNSWAKSDSGLGCSFGVCVRENCGFDHDKCAYKPKFILGPNDLDLMMRLRNAGSGDHRKFMRMIIVYVDITAPLYWWKEFDTYKVGTVANSCSTMHKIHEKEFTLEDFSQEHLIRQANDRFEEVVASLNAYRNMYINWDEQEDLIQRAFDYDKKLVWWQMIQLLPSSYNQKRTIKINYETLCNIYAARKNHKLDEWRKLCEWIEGLPFSELITGGNEKHD